MKKYLPLFVVIVFSNFFTLPAFGQSDSVFGPSNAQWWHNGDHPFDQEGMIYARVSGDTVIENVTCKKIEQTGYAKGIVGAVHYFQETPLAPLFVHGNSDTVWAYNENFNKFTPLYVFNVGEGDTVCLPVFGSDLRPNPIAGGDTCFCFVIDSIRTILYDTTYLQTFFEHSLVNIDNQSPNSWNSDWPVYNWFSHAAGNTVPFGAYTRKTGGIFGGLMPIRNSTDVANKPTSDTLAYSSYGLRCYVDDSIGIHIAQMDGQQCFLDSTTAISDVPTLNALVSFYPNPIQRSFQLKSNIPLPLNTELLLTDISGRVMEKLESPSGKTIVRYKLKEYLPGVYLLVLTANGERLVKKVMLTN